MAAISGNQFAEDNITEPRRSSANLAIKASLPVIPASPCHPRASALLSGIN